MAKSMGIDWQMSRTSWFPSHPSSTYHWTSISANKRKYSIPLDIRTTGVC